jgi:organic radical activating enzyme
MFGTNSITGKKFFKDAPADSLYVTSMFFTLQGEGPYAGMPALFIRLGKCNLACSFCDTFFDDGNWMNPLEIATAMHFAKLAHWNDRSVPKWAHGNDNIVLVITGGEPLLQSNLSAFLDRQSTNFKAVQIETNGTIDQRISSEITVVCSPKCSEKNGKAVKYLAPSQFILDRADCLKFVMSSDPTSPYNEVPEWAHVWRQETGKEIYCSPMNVYNDFPQKIKLLRAEKGQITMAERSTVDEKINFFEPGLINMEAAQQNHEHTGKYCLDHGFRLNMQQHLFCNMA